MSARHGDLLAWVVAILTIVTMTAVGLLLWYLNPPPVTPRDPHSDRPVVTGTYFPPPGVVCELDRSTGRVCTTIPQQ